VAGGDGPGKTARRRDDKEKGGRIAQAKPATTRSYSPRYLKRKRPSPTPIEVYRSASNVCTP